MKLKSISQNRKSAAKRRSGRTGEDRLIDQEVRLRKVLVPVDFSKLSNKAFQYATAFAAQFHAELHLLHVTELTPAVVTEFGYPAIPANDARLLRREALRHLTAWRKRISAGFRVHVEVRAGIPYQEIIAAAKELKCDLIMVGTHGRGGLTRLLIGSTADRVIRLASCPVLVVREHEQDFVKPVSKDLN